MSYIIPIGPYHPALEEPVHARLYTEGEVIKDAEVFVGYNHRGIEKLATERNAIQTLVLVERVCGICSHSHAFTYALCYGSGYDEWRQVTLGSLPADTNGNGAITLGEAHRGVQERINYLSSFAPIDQATQYYGDTAFVLWAK